MCPSKCDNKFRCINCGIAVTIRTSTPDKYLVGLCPNTQNGEHKWHKIHRQDTLRAFKNNQ